MNLSEIISLRSKDKISSGLNKVASSILHASETKASVILMIGAHVIRSGVQKYLIDLMERGYISCIAMNGAGVIHDYELALIGATTESVERYINSGEFGLWRETSRINDIVSEAARKNQGLGQTVGKAIHNDNFPNKDISLLAAGFRLGIPVTVHVGIGYDIVHEHPNCDGGAYGAASYTDFLRYTKCIENLSDGVVMNFGSAVMAPEVFLKALAMARNVAHQSNTKISGFTTLVCDLLSLSNAVDVEPKPSESVYYFRPLKTMLIRTIKDGGEGIYVQGNHKDTIPELWTAISDGNGEINPNVS